MVDLFKHNASMSSSVGFAGAFLWMLVGVVVPVVFLMMFNFVSDSYGVFGNNTVHTPLTNMNFLRMQHLLETDQRHEVLLLGSSRANAMDIRRHTSGSAYTLPVGGGYTDGHLLHLKALVSNNKKPEVVLLGLGEAAIKYPPTHQIRQSRLVRLHPVVTGIGSAWHTWGYLFYLPSDAQVKEYATRLSRRWSGEAAEADNRIAGLRETGVNYNLVGQEQRALQRSYASHVAFLESDLFSLPYHPEGERLAIETIEAIARLAQANGIELLIYIDPVYQAKHLLEDIDRLASFKRSLTKVAPFLDFNNFHSEFADPRSFFDTLHYTRAIGDRLAKDISRAMRGEIEGLDLGVWVTPENVDEYLAEQESLYLQLK